MKIIKFKDSIYEWEVVVLIVNNKKDIPMVKKIMKKFKVPKNNIDFDLYHIKKGHRGGVHQFNKLHHQSIVCVYNCQSINKISRILFHELRHVADVILSYAEINDSEAAATLTGYIHRKIVPKLFKLK